MSNDYTASAFFYLFSCLVASQYYFDSSYEIDIIPEVDFNTAALGAQTQCYLFFFCLKLEKDGIDFGYFFKTLVVQYLQK